MSDQPWYHEGLRFACLGCGRCCTGDPGYVWVTGEEIVELAEALAMSPTDFEEAFVRPVGKRKSLVEMPNGDCIFFDGQTRRCKLYSVRPNQCRTWPFWESNVRSPRTWEGTCRMCPGTGHGRLVRVERIRELAARVRL
jgi:Fe-S-cluster containining protein